MLNIVYGLLDARLAVQSPVEPPATPTVSLAYILSRSSGPILILLQQWVGLVDADHIDNNDDPNIQPWADLGISRHSHQKTDGTSPMIWEYEFSPGKMPSFVPRHQRRAIFEMGRSLRLLRQASEGRHPLCSGGWDVAVGWGWTSKTETS